MVLYIYLLWFCIFISYGFVYLSPLVLCIYLSIISTVILSFIPGQLYGFDIYLLCIQVTYMHWIFKQI